MSVCSRSKQALHVLAYWFILAFAKFYNQIINKRKIDLCKNARASNVAKKGLETLDLQTEGIAQCLTCC